MSLPGLVAALSVLFCQVALFVCVRACVSVCMSGGVLFVIAHLRAPHQNGQGTPAFLDQ
jgi:hypothetical protein